MRIEIGNSKLERPPNFQFLISFFNTSPKFLPIKSRFNSIVSQCWNLCCDQQGCSIEVCPVMLWSASSFHAGFAPLKRCRKVGGLNHFEFRRWKKTLHRFLQDIDVIHAVHQYHFWPVRTDVFKDSAYTTLVYMFLV